jgi:hypothetical protein
MQEFQIGGTDEMCRDQTAIGTAWQGHLTNGLSQLPGPEPLSSVRRGD